MNSEINLLSDLHSPVTRQEPRSELPQYLDFIREQTCLVCGGKSQAHHVVYKSKGNSCSDILTIPLCMAHHNWGSLSIHSLGFEEFQSFYEIEIHHEIILLLEKYINELTGEQKPQPKKQKVQVKKKENSVFKKVKNNRDGLEKCESCGLKSFPKDETRHYVICKFFELIKQSFE